MFAYTFHDTAGLHLLYGSGDVIIYALQLAAANGERREGICFTVSQPSLAIVTDVKVTLAKEKEKTYFNLNLKTF